MREGVRKHPRPMRILRNRNIGGVGVGMKKYVVSTKSYVCDK